MEDMRQRRYYRRYYSKHEKEFEEANKAYMRYRQEYAADIDNFKEECKRLNASGGASCNGFNTMKILGEIGDCRRVKIKDVIFLEDIGEWYDRIGIGTFVYEPYVSEDEKKRYFEDLLFDLSFDFYETSTVVLVTNIGNIEISCFDTEILSVEKDTIDLSSLSDNHLFRAGELFAAPILDEEINWVNVSASTFKSPLVTVEQTGGWDVAKIQFVYFCKFSLEIFFEPDNSSFFSIRLRDSDNSSVISGKEILSILRQKNRI